MSQKYRNIKFFLEGNTMYDDINNLVCKNDQWQYISFYIYVNNETRQINIIGYAYFPNQIRISTLEKQICKSVPSGLSLTSVAKPRAGLPENEIKKCKIKGLKHSIDISEKDIEGEFYEYGKKPLQGKKQENVVIDLPLTAINESVTNQIYKFMKYPKGIYDSNNTNRINAYQMFRVQFLDMIEKDLQDNTNLLPGLNDFNNFIQYIHNNRYGITNIISHESNVKIYVNETGKTLQKLTIQAIRPIDYTISKYAKDIILSYFKIFDKNYNYRTEKNINRLKMYFLLKFVDSGLKWLSGVGPVKYQENITNFNKIISSIGWNLNNGDRYYDISTFIILDYRKCITKKLLIEMVNFLQ